MTRGKLSAVEQIYACSALNKIQERIEVADLKKLEQQMKESGDLKTLLTTPAIDLPKKYGYLVCEIYDDDYKDKTLYYLIKQSCKRLPTTSFFSYAGDKITGFFAYIVGANNCISEIKMFSFDVLKPNPVLLNDMFKLLEDLRKKYKTISWSAMKANEANSMYAKAIEKYGGKAEEYNDDISNTITIHYSIPGEPSI